MEFALESFCSTVPGSDFSVTVCGLIANLEENWRKLAETLQAFVNED